MGHDGPPTYLWRNDLITDTPLPECPMRTLLRARETDPVGMQALDAVRGTYAPAFRQGLLPAAGGIADQPAHTLALIEAHERVNVLTQLAMQKVEADG